MSDYSLLFEPGRIGPLYLKNRVVMAPMGSLSFAENGSMTQRTIDYYVDRARGGVCLIMGQAARFVRDMRPGSSAIYDDTFVPGFRQLAEAVHEHDCRISWQLVHEGEASETWRHQSIMVSDLSRQAIAELRAGFAEAARRLKAAGLDGLELHGAHGYLIHQFLSPLHNKRSDEYGGSVLKRATFVCEVIQEVRGAVGSGFPIMLRLSGDDHMGGVDVDATVRQSPMFVEAGVNALDISAGTLGSYQWVMPCYSFPDGVNVHLAAAVKKAVNVPVIGAGKLGDPDLAAKLVAEGTLDFVALGRTLLADSDWANKVRAKRVDEIRHCVHCNNCHNMRWRSWWSMGSGFCCTVNPGLFREKDFSLRPATRPKEVMAVGGGIAGMTAAIAAGTRGHHVTLFEKESELGGQWLVACHDPTKAEYRKLIEYLTNGLKEAHVTTVMGKEVTLEDVLRVKPDVLIAATGAVPKGIDVPVECRGKVVQAVDVIRDGPTLGQKVVVIGGRHIGMDVAIVLAEQGRRVSLVTKNRLGEDGYPLSQSVYLAQRARLIELGVQLLTQCSVVNIVSRGVQITYQNDPLLLEADNIVLAVGMEARNQLAASLQGAVPEIHSVGDCSGPRDAMEAAREGTLVGLAI